MWDQVGKHDVPYRMISFFGCLLSVSIQFRKQEGIFRGHHSSDTQFGIHRKE